MEKEKNSLGRVLWISKAAYSAISKDELPINIPALLDSLSAVLSHLNDEKEPISKLLGKLKQEIKTKNKAFYPKVKQYFAKIYPILDYDFEKATRHVPAMIYGNDTICAHFVNGERDKARSMCEAMKSYPGFMFGEFTALSDKQFYDLVFGYYPKLYEKDDFMGEMKYLFTDEAKK
ncbi:MAG: hypothetical protein MR364_07625 [Oscillospiraceae bacterium]|nr:hypothetical protein [Oscillospiraceae bacterium]